jgi:GT2 family glycosyltransferase/glycosyltransferase involved in cell wall biosynthesis
LRRLWSIAWRIVSGLPALVIAPFLVLVSALVIFLADLLQKLVPKATLSQSQRPGTNAASVVIPNWNGRGLLAKYLPSVIAALADNSDNEVIVVDNGSSDGSGQFVREQFPEVRLLELNENRGFGGGSNAGVAAAKNDVVVLLNSDMRVKVDFLQPLLDGFSDENVFAVACQIFFSDPDKRREETGLTQGWWDNGGLRVGHRDDPSVNTLFPCFYGGGGSCAFDRAKFLELGGFAEVFTPFYLEDTDLGYMAWKRGWKVLYQPASVVYHEHRGTIGKKFSETYIQSTLKKNYLLFCWKNIHEWGKLAPHFFFAAAGTILSSFFGDSAERPNLSGLCKAFVQLPGALGARRHAQKLAAVSDTEAFRRPMGAYFRDLFLPAPADAEPLRVLFFSPYGIYPPTHGGGVFMYQTVRALAKLCELHLLILLDYESERAPHADMDADVESCELFLRPDSKRKTVGAISPHSVREFRSPDIEWLFHRQMYLHRIDVVQLEYTALGQYAGAFRNVPCVLFEHDVYFQSIARALPYVRGIGPKIKAQYEYLRALRYELPMLRGVDRVQVCSTANKKYLLEFLPDLEERIDDNFRAGIDTSRYQFKTEGREPDTLLFLGSFRHVPNQEGLQWFTREVLPRVLEARPCARLVVVGSEPPPRHALPRIPAIEIRGFVEDVREPLSRYSVFVCPILSGSGMRVKLLEAFAAGIPVVSTRLGAEGLAEKDGQLCRLADDPGGFADGIIDLLQNGEHAAALATRARAEVEATKDMAVMTRNLAESFRSLVKKKRMSY